MTGNQHDHISLDALDDYVDARLDARATRAIAAHLDTCAECADRHARLVSMLASARALPDAVEPPPELWGAVRDRVASRASFGDARRWWRLAAAAVILVVLSSAITTLVVRQPPVVVVRPAPPPAVTREASDSAPARAVDASYDAAIRELAETLAERRNQLDPSTAAKVEASLRVIDLAIAEARRALAADPANIDLHDLLTASYERKLELLRRANDLLSTI